MVGVAESLPHRAVESWWRNTCRDRGVAAAVGVAVGGDIRSDCMTGSRGAPTVPILKDGNFPLQRISSGNPSPRLHPGGLAGRTNRHLHPLGAECLSGSRRRQSIHPARAHQPGPLRCHPNRECRQVRQGRLYHLRRKTRRRLLRLADRHNRLFTEDLALESRQRRHGGRLGEGVPRRKFALRRLPFAAFGYPQGRRWRTCRGCGQTEGR
jgi:hypothetical protein